MFSCRIALMIILSSLWNYSEESLADSRIFASISISSEEVTFKPCYFPLSFNLTLLLENAINVSLALQRNVDLNVNSPAYVLDETGLTMLDSSQKINNFAVYHDVKSRASVSVQCSQKSSQSNPMIYTGSFCYGDQQYSFRPASERAHRYSANSKFRTSIDSLYVVSREEETTVLSHDYVYTAKSFNPTQNGLKDPISDAIRRRRASSWTPYVVDVLVVIDYSVFSVWYNKSEGQTKLDKLQETRNQLRRYFTHIMNGVDVLYKDITFADFEIRVQLAGYIIVEDKTTYPWNENRKIKGDTRDQLEADQALKDFRSWIKNQTGFPLHDHAMMFTHYDLYTKKTNSHLTHTAGLAFIGTLCESGDSVSIVEEHGGFQSVGTAAHELGHSLGARHDGESNKCRSEDRYIMAASGFGPVPETKRLNPWHFSSCSVDYFRDFIATLLAGGSTCLLKNTANSGLVVSTGNPGQEFDPDQQCRLIWGPKSYLCRGAEFGNASTICTAMYCKDPSTVSDCVLHTAARSTSCGNKKWCIKGICTFSEEAPEKNDDCLLGDQPGIAFNGLTCSQLVYHSASYCYQEKVRARCCDTCRRHFTWRKGCEYGDRVEGCFPWHCNHVFETRNIQQDCCSTCNVGEAIWSTPHPVAKETITPATPPMCLDVGGVNGMDCKTFVQAYGVYMCYNPTLSKLCCETCNQSQLSSVEGCEFGDQSPSLCARIANATILYCDKYERQCCQSCVLRGHNSASPSHHLDIPLLASALFFIVYYLYFMT